MPVDDRPLGWAMQQPEPDAFLAETRHALGVSGVAVLTLRVVEGRVRLVTYANTAHTCDVALLCLKTIESLTGEPFPETEHRVRALLE